MFSIITENLIWFLLAAVIGLATAWWIWGRLPDVDVDGAGDGDVDGDADTTRTTFTPEPEPAPEPPEPVAPVAAAAAGAGAVAASSNDDDVTHEEGKPKIAAAVGEPDDLTRIKGIGPKLNDLCQSLGVRRFDQIAKWGAGDVAEVDQYLKIKGRIDRDEWVAQAKLLAAGKDAEHKASYGMK